jgi:cysteinyl-tRNA synthetase
MNLTWKSLEDSQNALEKLYAFVRSIESENKGVIINEYLEKFQTALEDNLNTPLAIAVVWEMMKNKNFSDADKKATLLKFDEVLGFGFKNIFAIKTEVLQIEIDSPSPSIINIQNSTGEIIPEEIIEIIKERESARKNKDFTISDQARDKLIEKGYAIKDTPQGIEISKQK